MTTPATVTGESNSTLAFIVAVYNPPYMPGFLARNEVLNQIKAEHNEKR